MSASTIYSVDEVVGYSLFAKKQVTMYRLPDTTSQVVRVVSAGQLIGQVYSYIGRNGNLWWQIGDGFTVDGYVLHVTGYFDIDALRDQGALSTEELIAAQRAQEMMDANPFSLNSLLGGGDALKNLIGIGSGIGNTLITVLKYAAIILVGYALIRYVLPIATEAYKKHEVSHG